MAFVLVPHLDPSHVSQLTEILQRSTGMQVLEAVEAVTEACPSSADIIQAGNFGDARACGVWHATSEKVLPVKILRYQAEGIHQSRSAQLFRVWPHA